MKESANKTTIFFLSPTKCPRQTPSSDRIIQLMIDHPAQDDGGVFVFGVHSVVTTDTAVTGFIISLLLTGLVPTDVRLQWMGNSRPSLLNVCSCLTSQKILSSLLKGTAPKIGKL